MIHPIKYWIEQQVVGRTSFAESFIWICLKLHFNLVERASKYLLYTYLLILTFSPVVILPPNTAYAAKATLTPQLSVGGAYDDNIFFRVSEKTSSSIFTVSPGLELEYETLLSSVSLIADWDILKYLDESDLDRTNQDYRLSANHKVENRWDTSADLRFSRDTTLNTYLQETGRVVDRVERDFLQAGIRTAYDVTLLSGISAGYRYQNATYDSDAFSDYDNHRANLYYYHRLKSEIDKLSFGPSYYHRQNDFNDVDSFTLDTGWDRDWSRTTHTYSSIGARYTSIKRTDGTDDDSWGLKANFDLKFKGEISTTRIEYYHDIRTTVDGDDINVDNFFVAYDRLLTERFGAGVSGRIVFSYKLFDQQSDINDSRYYRIEPNLFCRLTERLRLSLQYRYQNSVEFRDDNDRTRERNVVWLRLSYGIPFFL